MIPKTPTTTMKAQPRMCRTAVNLTESWRLEHKGKNIRPINNLTYACDLNIKQWFRFSEGAGSRMLNKCPPARSCGAGAPGWTDGPMPTKVGQKVDTSFYVNYGSNCKHHATRLSVVRCSTEPNDFVYLQHQEYRGECLVAFCGMK